MKKTLVVTALLLVACVLTGCIKPYHLNKDWWKEKVERKDADWSR